MDIVGGGQLVTVMNTWTAATGATHWLLINSYQYQYQYWLNLRYQYQYPPYQSILIADKSVFHHW